MNRNFDIATNVFGLEMKVLKPDWYKYDVYCFYEKDREVMRYSWDENGCNAQMFANGVDYSFGYAEPLPSFFEDPEGREWDIVEAMQKRGFYFWMASEPTFDGVEFLAQFFALNEFERANSVTATTPQIAIAEAALKALTATELQQSENEKTL